MRLLGRVFRDRFLPAVLTAAGVTLLAAGLLHYGDPASAGPIAAIPTAGATSAPTSSVPLPSLPPLETSTPATPAPTATPDPHRVATRIVVEELDIDLPVIPQPNASYPSCNVAMYYEHPLLGQPGGGRSIYIYAHARTGMFLPLLTQARRNSGKGMVGMIVSVYTSDDQRFVYRITAVLPRVPADSHFLDKPLAVRSETLWLQTSTGPGAKYPKLQVVARPVGAEPADHAFAHPKARPVTCG